MNDKKRSGLGRGLAALLEEIGGPGAGPSNLGPKPGQGWTTIPTIDIRPNPRQPRRRFDDAEMQELIDSIKVNGLIQPILVRPVGQGIAQTYEIVAGERRWRAAQAAQIHNMPVVVRELDEQTAFEIAIIENVQRADLNPIEEAEGYQRLHDEFGNSQDDIAAATGKSRSHVANLMRLLKLPKPVLDQVREGALSMGHARALIGQDGAEALANTVIERGLSVRDTEALVASEAGRARSSRPRAGSGSNAGSGGGYKDPDTQALERALSEAVGLKVTVEGTGPSGRVVIDYGTLDQLDMVAQRLSGGRF